MPDSPTLFNVVVDPNAVTLRKIEAGRRGYEKAAARVILRERDAITLFQTSQGEAEPLQGEFSFQSLDNARTFALMVLKAREQIIENNLDQVQTYDGSTASSR